MNDVDPYADIDELFDVKSERPNVTLIEPMENDAYHNRYIALKDDVKAPIQNPNTYQETAFDDLDDAFPDEVEAIEEPIEGTYAEQALGVGKEAVAGVFEGVQGALDTFTDIDEALQDWGVPNYAIQYSDKDGLSFKEVSKETSSDFSPFNQDIEQFAPDLKPREESMLGDFVNEATEFITGYVAAGPLVKPFKLGKLASPAAKGAVADFTDYEPEEGGLLKFANSVPALEGIIPDIMVANEDDSRLKQRFKLAVEGVGLGILADKLFDAVIKVKDNVKNKGNDKAQESIEPERTGEAASEAPKKTEAPTSESTGSSGQGNSAPSESTTKTEVTPDELDMSDEILKLKQQHPEDPDIGRMYDEMAANGKVADRPSYIREVSNESVERILRDIETDPDSVKDGFYNLDRIDSPQQLTDALHYTAKEFDVKGLNRNTPKVKSYEQTIKEVAEDLQADEGDILKHLEEVSQTVGNLDVWVGQARALQHQAANEASSMAERIVSFQAPMKEQLEFVRRLQVLENMNEIMTGIKTGTGRGLSSMKIHTSEYMTDELDDVLKRIVCNL